MVTFTESQIATFDAQEREIFNALAVKANAKIENEDGGFDIRAYLARRAARESDEAECARQLANSFV